MALPLYFDIAARSAIKQSERWRKDVKEELQKAYQEGAEEALAKIRPLVPVGKTKKLVNSLKAKGTKAAGVVRAGTPRSIPYGPVVHWGRLGNDGPRFMWDQLTKPPKHSSLDPSDWLEDIMRRHIEDSIERLNRKLKKSIRR